MHRKDHTGGLKQQRQSVGLVIRLESHNVVVPGALDDLGKGLNIHANGHVAVTAKVLKALRAKEEDNKGHMGGVHGLHGNPRVGAVKVGVRDEVLDRVENLFQHNGLV